MSLKEKLTVSASPHVRSPETTTGIMLDVIISLIPALAASVWLFGLRTLLVTATTVLSCMLSEFFSRKIMKRQGTLGDLSAIVTGILLAFNLPATIPLWVAAIGSVVAIVVVKQFFGGIGQNFVNPALVGRIVLMASFPTMMSTWFSPLHGVACRLSPQLLRSLPFPPCLRRGTSPPPRQLPIRPSPRCGRCSSASVRARSAKCAR